MFDRNTAVVAFLMTCPTIRDNPLFFNFADESDGNAHIITESSSTVKKYIDGSVLRTYTFSIAIYESVAFNPLPEFSAMTDENIENIGKIQEVLDWINEQAENMNFPDFGEDCPVDSMTTLSSDPNVDGIDTSQNPPLARYSVGVKLEYLDRTKMIWN